jgi:hypothetical protein
MGRTVKERNEMGRKVIRTNRAGRIVKDEMSCTKMNDHRFKR